MTFAEADRLFHDLAALRPALLVHMDQERNTDNHYLRVLEPGTTRWITLPDALSVAAYRDARAMNWDYLSLVSGGDPWMHHFVVLHSNDNLRKQPALCGALPKYLSEHSTRNSWAKPPSASVALREMCPLCLGEVAKLTLGETGL